jgi:hypothetical protein
MNKAEKSDRAAAYHLMNDEMSTPHTDAKAFDSLIPMTDEQREELLTTLHGLGKFIERAGGERDTATAVCLYALCLAIREGAEPELARHILILAGDSDTETVNAAIEADNLRGH